VYENIVSAILAAEQAMKPLFPDFQKTQLQVSAILAAEQAMKLLKIINNYSIFKEQNI
jgi:hypothetical protein